MKESEFFNDTNENYDICSKCKGICCKSMACHYSPDDFKEITFEFLKSKIDEGFVSIDWWEGNPFDGTNSINSNEYIEKVFYLRARHINSDVVDPSYYGICKHLTPEGCELIYKDRPKGGRELIPRMDLNCEEGYSKGDSSRDWFMYQDVLIKLVDYYGYTKYSTQSSLEYSKSYRENLSKLNKFER